MDGFPVDAGESGCCVTSCLGVQSSGHGRGSGAPLWAQIPGGTGRGAVLTVSLQRVWIGGCVCPLPSAPREVFSPAAAQDAGAKGCVRTARERQRLLVKEHLLAREKPLRAALCIKATRLVPSPAGVQVKESGPDTSPGPAGLLLVRQARSCLLKPSSSFLSRPCAAGE